MANTFRSNTDGHEPHDSKRSKAFYRRDHRSGDAVRQVCDIRLPFTTKSATRSEDLGHVPKETMGLSRQIDAAVVKDPRRRNVATNGLSNSCSPTPSFRSPLTDNLVDNEDQSRPMNSPSPIVHTYQEVLHSEKASPATENNAEMKDVLIRFIEVMLCLAVSREKEQGLQAKAERARHADDRNRVQFKDHLTLVGQGAHVRKRAEQELETIRKTVQDLIDEREKWAAKLEVTFRTDERVSKMLAQALNDITSLRNEQKEVASKTPVPHFPKEFATSSELGEIQNAMQQLSNEVCKLKSANASQNAQIQKLELEVERNSVTTAQVGGKMSTIETENKNIRETWDHLHDLIMEIKGQSHQIMQSTKDTKASAITLKSSYTSQQEKLEALSSQIRGTEHSIKSLTNFYQNISTENITRQVEAHMSTIFAKIVTFESYISELRHLRQTVIDLKPGNAATEERAGLLAGIEAKMKSLEDQHSEINESAANFKDLVLAEKEDLVEKIASQDTKFQSIQTHLLNEIAEVDRTTAVRIDAVEKRIQEVEKKTPATSNISRPVESMTMSAASTSQFSLGAPSSISRTSERVSDVVNSISTKLLPAPIQFKPEAKRVVVAIEKNPLAHLDGWNARTGDPGAVTGTRLLPETLAGDSDTPQMVGTPMVPNRKRKRSKSAKGPDKDEKYEVAGDRNASYSISQPSFRKILRK